MQAHTTHISSPSPSSPSAAEQSGYALRYVEERTWGYLVLGITYRRADVEIEVTPSEPFDDQSADSPASCASGTLDGKCTDWSEWWAFEEFHRTLDSVIDSVAQALEEVCGWAKEGDRHFVEVKIKAPKRVEQKVKQILNALCPNAHSVSPLEDGE